MPRAILYTDIEWDRLLDFERPHPNERNPGFSAHNAARDLVQIGLVEEPKMKVHSCGSGGVRLRVGCMDQVHFFRELEEQLVLAMARSAKTWFGKELPLAHVRDMYQPNTLSGRFTSVLLRRDEATRVFVHEDGASRTGSTASLRAGTACCVIVGVKGLWIEEERWGAHLAVSDVLLFPGVEEDSDSDSEASAETEVRRRFQLGGGGGDARRRSRPRRKELTSDDTFFRELRDEALDDEENASWSSRMPFGTPRDRRPARRSAARGSSSRSGSGSGRRSGGSEGSASRASSASDADRRGKSRSGGERRSHVGAPPDDDASDLPSDAAADRSDLDDDFELDLSEAEGGSEREVV